MFTGHNSHFDTQAELDDACAAFGSAGTRAAQLFISWLFCEYILFIFQAEKLLVIVQKQSKRVGRGFNVLLLLPLATLAFGLFFFLGFRAEIVALHQHRRSLRCLEQNIPTDVFSGYFLFVHAVKLNALGFSASDFADTALKRNRRRVGLVIRLRVRLEVARRLERHNDAAVNCWCSG
jgi:hypothetical protein